MPGYSDLANVRMPSLADLMAAVKARRAQNAQGRQPMAQNAAPLPPGDLPGKRPDGSMGRPMMVGIEGEAPTMARPIEAQPQPGGPTLAQRYKGLMSQGMSSQDAIRQMVQDGHIGQMPLDVLNPQGGQ